MLKLQTTDTRGVWKVLSTNPAHTRAIPNLSGAADFESKYKALRTSLFPPRTVGNDIPTLKTSRLDLREDYLEITSQEVLHAINRCNKQSARGHDKVLYCKPGY